MAKSRLGFVSNSSSSSFVVIGRKPFTNLPTEVILGEHGTTEFGWEIKNHTDFYSRLQWAYLQAEHTSNEEWHEMITDALDSEGITITGNIMNDEWDKPGKVYAYIDHQSVGGRNSEIFDSLGELKQFLFAPDSYVHTDNDNH